MITVGHPGGKIFPVGDGIGATQAGAVSDLAVSAGAAVEVARDLAHRDRALILRWGLGKGE